MLGRRNGNGHHGKSLESLSDLYIMRCEVEGKSPNTLKAYAWALRRFTQLAQEEGFPEDVRQITPAHIYAYLGRFSHLSLETRHRYHREVSCFFNWLQSIGYVNKSPFTGIKKVRLPQKIVQPFSPDNVLRLLDCCDPGNPPGARGRAVNPKARKIVLDVCVQIAPPREREAKAEISFERVRQLIYDWEDRGFKVKGGQVSYDGWQSIDSQQQLKRKGFRVAEFSLDRDVEGHDTLQELANCDELSFYRHAVLIREARALSLLRGKKVDHPKGGSKDVVDAVAGACYFALKRGGRMTFVG